MFAGTLLHMSETSSLSLVCVGITKQIAQEGNSREYDAHSAHREVKECCMHVHIVQSNGLQTHYWVMMANSFESVILFTQRDQRQQTGRDDD